MAKISLDLNQFKANGVYTVEYDESEITVVNSEQLRLIVGFSRKGPFNAPVFLKDTKSARKIFGEIDTLLEKRGSFFHRAIETALRTGPVYAINLLPLDNTPTGDKIDYRSFSLSMNEKNSDTATALYSSFFNKERFWAPDLEYFEAIVNNNEDTANKLISFTNLGQTPMSIIVRKAKDVTGFDITARDFYGEDDIPEYVNKFAYIRDYFIDIIAVKGDWTDYNNLSIDPDYSTYFSKNGVKADTLNKFLASDKITKIGSWTGCIIPDFTDKTGANWFIETIVNSSQQLTGLYMTINRTALDDYANSKFHVDMIGNSILDGKTSMLNMLSYSSPLEDVVKTPQVNKEIDNVPATELGWTAEDFQADGNEIFPFMKSVAYNDARGKFYNTLVIPKPRPSFVGQKFGLVEYNNLVNGETRLTPNSIVKNVDGEWIKINNVVNTGNSIEVGFMPYYNEKDPDTFKNNFADKYYNFKLQVVGTIRNSDGTFDDYFKIAEVESSPMKDIEQLDLIFIPEIKAYIKVKEIKEDSGNTLYSIVNVKSSIVNEWLKTSFSNSEKGKIYEALLQDSTDTYNTMIPDGIQIPADQEEVLYFKYNLNPDVMTVVDANVVEKQAIDDAKMIKVYTGSPLYEKIANKSIINGDRIAIDGTLNSYYYIGIENGVDEKYGLKLFEIRQYLDENLVHEVGSDKLVKDLPPVDLETIFSYDDNGEAYEDGLCLFSDHNSIKETVDIETVNSSKTVITISAQNASKIEVGQYLVAQYKYEDGNVEDVLTRVISKTKKLDPDSNKTIFEITVNEPLKITKGASERDQVYRYLDINDQNFTTDLLFTKLNGFRLTEYHLPNDTEIQLNKILSVIEDTNIGKTLADNDIIQFRYIVDTFDGFPEKMMGSKVILSRLAKSKGKCMALLNVPSIKKFTNSVDPRFTEEPDPENGNPKPILNCEYIATGGNLSLGPAKVFSFPDDDNGAKYIGCFTPFIKIRENNRDKMIPPAADISNNFINKFKAGNKYSITAGPRRGVISNPDMTGLEYDFLKEDRGYLEPVGFNCLINSKQYGPMIYGNATAYQKTISAFNNLHVRDLLITIENDVEDMLSNYVFEFNDAATRLEIKTMVEKYLETVRELGGIYDFMVVMDETNNTPTVIDQNVGILDIGIEPARGMQRIINRITVLKTGAISSGGFSIN